jgi:hypothetical protein
MVSQKVVRVVNGIRKESMSVWPYYDTKALDMQADEAVCTNDRSAERRRYRDDISLLAWRRPASPRSLLRTDDPT